MKRMSNVLRPAGTARNLPYFSSIWNNGLFVGSPRTKKVRNHLGRCSMKRLLIAFALILAGCAPVAEMIQNAGQPTAKTASATEQSIDQAQLEPYNGPKARVAVSRFTDQSGKGNGIAVGYPGF